MQENISPEERLLRLIQGKGKKPLKQDKEIVRQPEPSQPNKVTQDIAVIEEGRAKKFSFSLVNYILIAILLASGAYLLLDFLIIGPGRIERAILDRARIDKETYIPSPSQIQESDLMTSSATSFSDQPVSYYTQAVESDDIFAVPAAETKQLAPEPSILEVIAQFKLQGIISGAQPQAIIEDTKTKQIYFLSPGEGIGEIKVMQILPGKVKLKYHDQEAELSL